MTGRSPDAYRRALRWYPTEWREKNGDNTISAFLDRDDATGLSGPTRGDRRELAWEGLRASLAAAVRPPRLILTAIGTLFLLAAWSLVSVILEVGRRDLTLAAGGFVDLMGRSYSFPVLVAAGLVGLAWLCAAVTASHRGHRLLAAAIALGGLASAWTTYHLSWPRLITPGDSGTQLLALGLLSVVGLAAPLLTTLAAMRAGILTQPAPWLVSAASAAQVLGAWALIALDRTTVVGVLLIVGSALLSPLSLVVAGASFAFLSRASSRREEGLAFPPPRKSSEPRS